MAGTERKMTAIPEEDALLVHPTPSPPPPEGQSWESRSDVTSEDFLKYGVALYHAALDGDSKTLLEIGKIDPGWMSRRITKGGETVLHIAAAAKHLNLVRQLVNVMEVPSLSLTNNLGNTALCFAAVTGIVEIARIMIEKDRGLPNIRGSQHMTPLHMAVLLGHKHMVAYLLNVTDDDLLNDQDRIALLTSSIDTNLFEVALHILHNHQHLAVVRDSKNETALHALARKPLKCIVNQLSTWQHYKLKWINITHQQRREEPQSVLELTHILWKEVIKQKAEGISNLIGYPWRLLFVAAKLGKVEFLTTLIRSYPDVIWKVDENRRSIFHIAVIHRHEEIFKLIHEIGAIKDLIATYKDADGNNMLHLASRLAPSNRLNTISGAALQMQLEILWFEEVKKIVRPEYAEAENAQGKTPQDLFTEEHEGLRAKGEEWMKKTAESCALVATLIATMVFSATFQLPGGVNQEGNPVLVKRAAFVAFAISDAISLFTSTASILMFLSILTSRYAERDFRVSLPLKLMQGLILLLISIATMIIAFTSALFIIFHEGVRWIQIPIALVACIPVTLFIFQQFPLLVDIYHSTYKSQLTFEPTKPRLFRNSSQHDHTPNDLNINLCTKNPTSQSFSAVRTPRLDMSHHMLSFTVPFGTPVDIPSKGPTSHVLHRRAGSDPTPRLGVSNHVHSFTIPFKTSVDTTSIGPASQGRHSPTGSDPTPKLGTSNHKHSFSVPFETSSVDALSIGPASHVQHRRAGSGPTILGASNHKHSFSVPFETSVDTLSIGPASQEQQYPTYVDPTLRFGASYHMHSFITSIASDTSFSDPFETSVDTLSIDPASHEQHCQTSSDLSPRLSQQPSLHRTASRIINPRASVQPSFKG